MGRRKKDKLDRPVVVSTLREILEVERNVKRIPMEKFATGSVRDTQEGKLRYDLVPWDTFERVVQLYTSGAGKYGDDNWRKGQPMKRTFASLMRHLMKYIKGQKDEDHASAVIWNMLNLMWTEEHKPELNDLFKI